ncbi:MAG: hypothetical protein A2X08_11225 [Bacteroidetes bacterium GWA2_32_17]|nr:MAG: hypothetical protein A2X08_11225 [Bacteroidetes bacterium GWA2_32_17]
MKIIKINPKKSLNKAFLKQRPLRTEIDLFKSNLIRLLGKVDEIEREENQKNHIRDFLLDTYYKNINEINTKDSKDLVIHLGKTNKEKVGVIIEAKRPENKIEMLSENKPNSKAFQELVLYYLRERIEENNIDIKYLIVTNIYEWYMFEASYFEKLFFRNSSFVKQYEEWRDGQKVTTDTNLFYNSIAKPFIAQIEDEVPCIYFDIRDYEEFLRNNNYEDDKNLIALQKLLSPFFLLKVPFANDSNSLNENFYKELLHIVGLEEVKDGSKNVIRRKEKDKQAGSLIEITISILITEDSLNKIKDKTVYGETKDEQLFNVALELCLIWINRILFLKLLEGKLITYHKGNKEYRFLNSETLNDFDELYKLFHQVLAKNTNDRTINIKQKYAHIPYLNSSLFEFSELENLTIKINSLDNSEAVNLISNTVLKEEKRKISKLPTLEYLLKFLDAYDFASEGCEDIAEENKSIINASVLGKVFEKINGYKDGSIFTPGFITMYMSRQSLQLAVVQKFNEYFKSKKITEVNTFEELYNRIEKIDIKTSNGIINSLKICDPAVGSGHFLVSVLNELIVIKSELGILVDKNGKRLKDYEIEVDNDELIISDENGIFEYNYQNKESQRIQETIFNERKTIIENCLFGVDINPNSVKICQLRLWIELLKSSYYKTPDFTELETLPNIDINIKCGNSLISRFALDIDLKQIAKSSKWSIFSYQNAVEAYKNSTNKQAKQELEKFITDIKANYITAIQQHNPKLQKLYKLKREYDYLFPENGLFLHEPDIDYGGDKKKIEQSKQSKQAELERSEKAVNDEKVFYERNNAFEWRFEFPEVLNNNGDFKGFDVVISNPPYGVSIKDTYREIVVSLLGKVPDFEIYYFFINLSKKLLKPNGINSFIIPNTILFNVFAKKYRENLFNNWQINEILDCTEFNVFEGSATVRCIITQFINKKSDDFVYYRPTHNINSFKELINRALSKTTKEILLANNQNWALVFKLNANTLNLISKIKFKKKTLSEYFPEISQGLIAYDKYQGQNEATIKNRIYHSIKSKSGWKKWLWGEDITPYSVIWNGKEYINYCEGIANPREPIYFNNERILVREITNPKIYAGYTSEESYNDPAIINILIKKNGIIKIKVLLSILNSKLATFYHFNSSPKATKGAFPKILVEDLKNFPIPSISLQKQNIIIEIVDKIISQKQHEKDTTKLEKQIDELVYKLYEITPEEQKLIE